MAFKPGDHVVYPAYGAGTVVATEERVFAGTTTRYYILKMVADEGEFLVPVDQAGALGVRPVTKKGAILKTLRSAPAELAEDYKERQAGIEKLLATSDAFQMGLGARDLAWYSGSRSLTGRDVQLYEDLQTQLASELSLAEGITLEEARARLLEALTALTAEATLQAAERAAAEEAEE